MIWKAGQKVKRIKDDWRGMKVGDIGTLDRDIHTQYFDTLYLMEYSGGHSIKNFILIPTLKSLLEETK